jgi:GAF domain-containing protein
MTGDGESRDVVRAAMAKLVADFATPTNLPEILKTVTTGAVALIHRIDFADVLLVDEQQFRSMAETETLAIDLDSVQLDLQEGPCLSAATRDATVVCPDLTAEQRWPDFAAAAVQAGVHSMMSFQLYSYPAKTHGGTGGRGALNLYGRKRHEFTFEDRALGAMLATHAAAALLAADRQTQFESALASRDTIGQAKGILMERFHVDALRAFGLMTKLSQDSNTPVRVVAKRIVDTV